MDENKEGKENLNEESANDLNLKEMISELIS